MYIHVQHTKTLFLCHFKLLSDDTIQLHDTSNCHWMPIILLRCWPESKVDAFGGVRLHQVCLGVIHLPPYNCKNKIKLKRLISSRTCACRILLSVYAIKKQYLLVKFRSCYEPCSWETTWFADWKLTELLEGSHASQCQEYPLCFGVFFIGGSRHPKW